MWGLDVAFSKSFSERVFYGEDSGRPYTTLRTYIDESAITPIEEEDEGPNVHSTKHFSGVSCRCHGPLILIMMHRLVQRLCGWATGVEFGANSLFSGLPLHSPPEGWRNSLCEHEPYRLSPPAEI